MKKLIYSLTCICILLFCLRIRKASSDSVNYYSLDSVIVTINTDKSLEFSNLSKNDFGLENIRSIFYLNEDIECIVKDKINRKNDEKYLNINPYNFHKIYELKFDAVSEEELFNIIDYLKCLDFVYWAEPNYFFSLDSSNLNIENFVNPERLIVPTEPNIYNLMGINTMKNSLDLYDQSFVDIGILDSGVNPNNPDFLIDNTSIVDLNKSYDFVLNSSNIADYSGHGTCVAGIIAAINSNGIGIDGICPKAKIVSLRVINDNEHPQGSMSNIVRAISRATLYDIKILNLSLSFDTTMEQLQNGSCHFGNTNDFYSLKNSIENYPGLVICSAGNQGICYNDSDDCKVYPGCFDSNNIICVGACMKVESDLLRWSTYIDDGSSPQPVGNISSSNYGYYVDVFAFGKDIDGDIVSLSNNCVGENITKTINATSAAAPFVTGVAASILSCHSSYDIYQIKDIILSNSNHMGTTDSPNLNDNINSAHLLNASFVLESQPCNHSFSYTQDLDNSHCHLKECINCDYMISEVHICNEASCGDCLFCNYSSSLHHEYCEYHKTNSSTTHNKICLYCGLITSESHNFVEFDLVYKCTICGYISRIIPIIHG